MIQVDGSVVIQIINFVFLIWALNLVLYKPIRSMLLQRKEKVEGFEEGIDRFNRDAMERRDAYMSGIKKAREKGLRERDTLVSAAVEEEKTIIGEINTKARADLEKVRGKILKEVEGVSDALQKEVDVFAKAISKKILGRAV